MTLECIASESGDTWAMYHGDCCQVIAGIPDASLDFGVHSPPFSGLYIYSASEADMGNAASNEEFIEHYRYLIREMLRATIPGRLCAVHCKDLPKYANRDETTGLFDFPGMIVKAYESEGWSFHSRVTIWKCPVVERERTNNNGLLHKTVLRDRSQLRMGMADFLLVFRRPPSGTLMSDKPIATQRDAEPVGFEAYCGMPEHDPRKDDYHPSPHSRKSHATVPSIDIWRRYAEPVWWDIDQMDVLNYRQARDENDERHICPLQLGVIARAVEIWSLPGEVVFSPFAGIGSEGVGALRQGRKFVGVELKESYYIQACRNLRRTAKVLAESERTLFSNVE